MSKTKSILNLVVAACNSRGIGKNGQLPWRIRKDMDFFKKITMETKDPDKKNVVIMGRKTWFSIPEKFRPLPKRINIILSREMKEAPSGVYIARSFDEAITMVNNDLSDKVESIYVIGGSSIYKAAMDSDYDIRIFLTKILADYDCDTFLPQFDENLYKIIENYEGVPKGKQTENDIDFIFEVYEKNMNQMCEFDIMAAMCSNRGIGMNNKLPWPYIEKDYEYYTQKCSPNTKGKYTVVIKGRMTWECTKGRERTNPGYLNVIISHSKRDQLQSDEYVHKVADNLDAALIYANKLKQEGKCERVWVLGGQKVYDNAVHHPCCKKIYLTEIYKDFPSDTFFPPLPSCFKETGEEGVDPDIQEDNGLQFQFKVFTQTE
ncbi:DHFR [Mytilus coruscus]|uniref:dihydrofolate reductase n=1 Tax=Mytilus coruscus TaxID=42192 RepID=A0A6J8E626_MYTCO|nr:DHFR [Mytilus coruscus]